MTAPASTDLIYSIRARFGEEFGSGDGRTELEPRLFFAPGRINIVGAHLDYNGGDVLPMAVDRGLYLAARRTPEPQIRLRSLDQDLAVDVPVADIEPRSKPEHGWASYPLGVWEQFARIVPVAGGLDLVYGGDLPMASGLSSSAAIEVVTAIALERLFDAHIAMEELALLCHRAETGYVGLKCGIMDQFASALCRPQHVLLLHCSGPSYEHVPLPADACEVLVMDTKKPRELAESRFNQVVAECAEAHRALVRGGVERPHLARYSLAEVEACAQMADAPRKRARHVVTEMGRIATGVRALREGDIETLGRMLSESHASTAVDYEVSCEELDVITEAARTTDGCYGARLTGAGFGGCAIALVESGCTEAVRHRVSEVFHARFGVEPGFDVLRPGPGAREIREG